MPRVLKSRPIYDEAEAKWFFTLIDAELQRYHMSQSLYNYEQDADAAAALFLKVAMQGRFSPGV